MFQEELYREISMSYYELVEYLLDKYGAAQYDYFCNDNCKSQPKKLKRTSEGLICHHIREDMGGNLNGSGEARTQPYEWQQKQNLVYCNLLEHLILHIKIDVLRQKHRLFKPDDISHFFTTGGVYMVCQDVNDLFVLNGTKVPWKQRCYEEIKENYEEYCIIIKSVIEYIVSQYIGSKEEMSSESYPVRYRLKNGEEQMRYVQLPYEKCLIRVTQKMCKGYKDFYERIYNDILNCNDEKIISITKLWSVDYIGYEYPQFTDCKLDKDEFGSCNIDEYLYKALPSFSNPDLKIGTEIPHFWKGKIPNEVFKNKNINFIVRIKTCFNLKKGEIPFVRYKEDDYHKYDSSGNFLIAPITEENNLLFKKGVVLEKSYVYSHKTNLFHSKIKDSDGNVVPATVILSLERNDFELFQKRYDIEFLEFLDGCYF